MKKCSYVMMNFFSIGLYCDERVTCMHAEQFKRAGPSYGHLMIGQVFEMCWPMDPESKSRATLRFGPRCFVINRHQLHVQFILATDAPPIFWFTTIGTVVWSPLRRTT
jgi:hypothetical protein